MKFPGLDFSALEGVTVTSAVVTLRDLMCETEELSVTCYPSTGSVWTESTAQWSTDLAIYQGQLLHNETNGRKYPGYDFDDD